MRSHSPANPKDAASADAVASIRPRRPNPAGAPPIHPETGSKRPEANVRFRRAQVRLRQGEA